MKTGRLRFGSTFAYYKGVNRSERPGQAAAKDKSSRRFDDRQFSGGGKVLHYALVFFLIAIVAAVLGFGGISVASAGIAKILFFLFLVIFLVTLVMGVARRA